MINKFLALSLGLILISCSDILVPDISSERITVLQPNEGGTISAETIQFQWDAANSIIEYAITLTDLIDDIVILSDTTSQRNYTYTLDTGEYRLEIVGLNDISMTSAVNVTFRVVQSNGNAQNISVRILNPKSDTCTNDSSIPIIWRKNPALDKFIIEITSPTNGLISYLTQDSVTIINLNTEGEYAIDITGWNEATGTTSMKAGRKIRYDTTSPDAPLLSSPLTGAVVSTSNEVRFEWTVDMDVQSSEFQLYDNNVNTIKQIKTELSSISLTEVIAIDSIFTNRPYYWQVKSRDKAGNTSDQSELRIIYFAR